MDDPLVRDLLRPENLPPPAPSRVEFVSTHASFVFLTERFVYKVKRAKDYGFFDYSTLEKRKHFCEEEVRLNRRTAADVYLGVQPVFRDASGFSMNRPGPIADYAVQMVRLPDDRSALALVKDGRLTHDDLDAVARFAARFYSSAAPSAPRPESLATILQENFRQVEPYIGRFIGRDRFEETRVAQEAWMRARLDRLSRREARDGHGDLRLEHVYLMPRGPIVIDCIEFSELFRVIDPALDLAFFAMELVHFGRPDLAEYFLGRAALERDDYDSYPLIDGYIGYRAWVRAKVSCFLAGDPTTDAALAREKEEAARKFFELSNRTLSAARPQPRLIAVGGLIGSGKSTLAAALAREISAPVVGADATRKFLAGRAHDAAGDESLYAPEFTERVQAEVLRRAEQVLEARRTVIVDTTFRSRELRGRARRAAAARGARFLMIECRVPDGVARERLRARAGGVSDAREALFESFKKSYEPVTELPPGEHIVADTSQPISSVLAALPLGKS